MVGIQVDDLGREQSGGLLWAFRFVEGRAYPVEAADDRDPAESAWDWTHFALSDTRAQARLARTPGLPTAFHELVAERDERIQLHAQDGWTFGVAPDLERDLAGKPQGAGRLYFALDARRLTTARLHALRAVDDVRRQAEQGLRLASPAAVVAAVIERFAEVLEERLERLADRLDEVEDEVLGEPSDVEGLRLGPLRRELSRHRRELQNLRGAFARASAGRDGADAGLLAEHLGPLSAAAEELDREAAGLQDRARLLHEEIDTLITAATNRSMRALTVISTLLIPPTLIVGAFGMNLSGIPFAGSHAGFTFASMLCLAVVAAAWILLRRRRLLP